MGSYVFFVYVGPYVFFRICGLLCFFSMKNIRTHICIYELKKKIRTKRICGFLCFFLFFFYEKYKNPHMHLWIGKKHKNPRIEPTYTFMNRKICTYIYMYHKCRFMNSSLFSIHKCRFMNNRFMNNRKHVHLWKEKYKNPHMHLWIEKKHKT